VRALLAARLRERRAELESAVVTRVWAIQSPDEVPDPAYPEGLRAAVSAAIGYRLDALELGERRLPEVPTALLAQARLDARDGVSLDTVLRRYFAGSALFADFLADEAGRAAVGAETVRRLLGEQATLADRLLAAISAEHSRESASRPTGLAERRRRCAKRLLAGEMVDATDLDYELRGHHVGVMVKGGDGDELLREVGGRLDRRWLAVRREEEEVWGCWLGGGSPLAAEEVVEAFAAAVPAGTLVTVGEDAEGLSGWRFSHLQAKAALPVAERRREPVLRFLDVALVAGVMRDELVATSLRRLYLDPLARSRDGGAAARETLRSYFAAERNVSSTAAALGVDRRTVRNRIRAIEVTIGRSLKDSAADLEIALRLDE
jgi:DNA-binding PucR family transcriptional regulator